MMQIYFAGEGRLRVGVGDVHGTPTLVITDTDKAIEVGTYTLDERSVPTPIPSSSTLITFSSIASVDVVLEMLQRIRKKLEASDALKGQPPVVVSTWTHWALATASEAADAPEDDDGE